MLSKSQNVLLSSFQQKQASFDFQLILQTNYNILWIYKEAQKVYQVFLLLNQIFRCIIIFIIVERKVSRLDPKM